jgi:hypothetical protein
MAEQAPQVPPALRQILGQLGERALPVQQDIPGQREWVEQGLQGFVEPQARLE